MTLEEVVPSCTQKTELLISNHEVEGLKQELATEKKRISAMSTELQILKTERQENKSKTESTTFLTKSFEDRRYMQSKARLELEDAENTIAELKEELDYKTRVNHSLALQLEKTIESNSELLLEIKDLDDLLQSREIELEKIRGKDITAFEEDKALWMKKLEQSEQELKEEKALWRKKLEESEQMMKEEKALWMEKLEESEQMIKDLKLSGKETALMSWQNNTEELDAAFNKLKKDFEKVEIESAEIREENMNLLSQLMSLRHETDEKDDLIHQLESKFSNWQDHLDKLPTSEDGSEKKLMKELQSTVNDLREKLHISEELSQSQLDSNKAFLEDLNSMVEALQTKNKQLEQILKSSEESNASLTLEVATLRKDILEHEKEQSMLGLLRGQMKALREKIAVTTQKYDIAMKQIENVEIINKNLKEEHDESIFILKNKLTSTEQKLHEMDVECHGLKNSLAEAETRLKQKHDEVEFVMKAKEDAEVSLSLLQEINTELQEHINSLVIEKENVNASLLMLKKEHSDLQEDLRESEKLCSQRCQQLQMANDTVTNLNYDFESAQDQLQKALDNLDHAESTKSDLAQQLKDAKMQITNMDLQLSHMNEDTSVLKTSLSASEDRLHLLQLENAEISAKLSSAVSEKEEIDHRLAAAKERESELEKKVVTMGQELLDIENETVVYEETMAQLESRLRILSNERIDQQSKMLAELQGLKASLHETQLEKEKAKNSIDKLQDDNTKLTLELAMWKEKMRADDDEIRALKERLAVGGLRHRNASLEEKNSTLSLGTKKNVLESDKKIELIRLRKHTADLKKKFVEQEEGKDEIKKKLSLLQRDAQHKSDLPALSEKKPKEKEKEESACQRLAKAPPKVNHKMISNGPNSLSQSAKAMFNLSEKVKLLEEQINNKTVELEATKSLLKEKEEKPYNKLEHGSDLQNINSDEASHEDEMNTLTRTQEEYQHHRNLSSRPNVSIKKESGLNRLPAPALKVHRSINLIPSLAAPEKEKQIKSFRH